MRIAHGSSPRCSSAEQERRRGEGLPGDEGDDILIGGEGSDDLNGESGQDLLIGGRGSDRLNGGTDDDMLVAGYTDDDDRSSALGMLLSCWTGPLDYSARVNALLTGGGSLKGSGLLLSSLTVHEDNAKDQLTGGSGRNLFFANVSGIGMADRLGDLQSKGHRAEVTLDI